MQFLVTSGSSRTDAQLAGPSGWHRPDGCGATANIKQISGNFLTECYSELLGKYSGKEPFSDMSEFENDDVRYISSPELGEILRLTDIEVCRLARAGILPRIPRERGRGFLYPLLKASALKSLI